MNFWNPNPTSVNEACSCGATFRFTGMLAMSAAHDWRTSHRCRPPQAAAKVPRNSEHPEAAPEDHRPSDRPAEIDSGDHECDSGWFDRTLCPEPCGAMHSYCDTCGKRDDPCAHDEDQP